MDYAALALLPRLNFAPLQEHDRSFSIMFPPLHLSSLQILRSYSSTGAGTSKWNVGLRSSRPQFRVPRPPRGTEESEPKVSKSWLRRLLFESIEMDDANDDEESEFSDELEEKDFPNFESPDEVDEMPDDDNCFLRWKTKTEARNSKSKSVKPKGRAWEDWLDDGWNQENQGDGNFEKGK